MWLQVCGDEMLSALGMLLKCADLGHMTQPFANHRVWVRFCSRAALFIFKCAPCTCMLLINRTFPFEPCLVLHISPAHFQVPTPHA